MSYNLDLSLLSVQDYKELLKNQNLLPGRRILWQNIDRNFEAIGRQGIVHMAQLKKRLSTPQRVAALAAAAGIPEEYLTVLKRELGSLEQNAVPLTSFPETDGETVSRLSGQGIINSREYFDSGVSGSDELFCLCDLVRINGVGPVAARAFYDAGYRRVREVACAEADVMLERVSAINDTRHYYKASLGVKDMQFCIDFAKLLMKYGS